MEIVKSMVPESAKRKRRWISGVGILMLIVAAVAVSIANVTNHVRHQKRGSKTDRRGTRSAIFDYQLADQVKPPLLREPPAPRWIRRIVGDAPFRSIIKVELGVRAIQEPVPPMALGRVLHALQSQPKLDSLLLGRISVTDNDCRILSQLTHFRELHASYTGITDKGVAEMATMRNLKFIDLWGVNMSNEGLESLAKITSLEGVRISSDSITDTGIAQLKRIPRLNELDIDSENVHGEGLEHLRNLETLNITSGRLDDESLAIICRLSRLKVLSLYEGRISQKGLKHLESLVDLLHLGLHPVTISDEGIEFLARLPKLESLMIGKSRITVKGLETIASMKSLKYLELGEYRLGREALEKLAAQRPDLEVYDSPY